MVFREPLAEQVAERDEETGRTMRSATFLKRGLLGLCCGGIVVLAMGRTAVAEEGAMKDVAVGDNARVGLEYTLTVDGAVVDSTQGKGAFHYIQGHHEVIPGLERQLAGLHMGDKKELTVAPEEGYGPVDAAAFVEVKKSQLPPTLTPTVGMSLRGVNPDGRSFRATVAKVNEQTVLLNLNHPLAGKTLNFSVQVTDIVPASTQ